MKKTKFIPSKKGIKNKVGVFLLLCLLLFLVVFLFSRKEEYKTETKYFTGSLTSYNGVANLFDTLPENENLVFSPYNFYTLLDSFYGATDNQTYKEIKNYVKMESSSYHEMFSSISFLEEEEVASPVVKYYEELMQSFFASSYQTLSMGHLRSFSDANKEKLITLISKINATYSCIEEKRTCNVKSLKNVLPSKEYLSANIYTIKTMLTDVLDTYENYHLETKVSSMNHFFIDTSHYSSKQFEKNIFFNTEYLPFTIDAPSIMNTYVEENISNGIDFYITSADIYGNHSYSVHSLVFESSWEENMIHSVQDVLFTTYRGDLEVVPMMYGKTSYYLENAYATGFIKKYKNPRYSFVAILPKSKEKVSLSSLQLDSLLKSRQERTTLIGIPKFSVTSTIEYPSLLKKVGIENIFLENANFNKWSHSSFFLEDIKGKYTFSVAEKGTYSTSLQKQGLETFTWDADLKEVVLNRPFYYMVIDEATSLVLLVGHSSDFIV